jgi:hypothetical protein
VESARTILSDLKPVASTWVSIDVNIRSRFTRTLVLACLAACGGTPQAKAPSTSAPITGAAPLESTPTEELKLEPPHKLLAIDWSTVRVASESDALALWTKIAPTGDDWTQRMDEVPQEFGRSLAIALLRAGNFACMPVRPARDCSVKVFDVPEPAPTAGLTDPCLRRQLALWAIDQLEDDDVPSVMDSLRTLAALPPPEAALVTAAIRAVPETDQTKRLEVMAIAWRANQHDVVNALIGTLDEPHLIEAASKHHVDGALDTLAAKAHRAVFLAAVTDEAMGAKARASAITELVDDDKLAADLRAALVKATASKDCAVAAAAVRALESRGEKKYTPTRPRTAKPEAILRGLCVLASYEKLQRSDETSLLATYVPAKGLERITVAYDALAEVDEDGDGDPHTVRTAELVPRDQLVLPEIDDLVRAMQSCKGTTCTSDDREYRFGLKSAGDGLQLFRLEIVERPPCPRS